MLKKTLAPKKVNLSKISTQAPKSANKKDIEEKTEAMAQRISELQEMLFANANKNLLVVLQGMDTAGKDGCTRATFGRCTPIGVSAFSFKKPTEEEFAHDFLWRVNKQSPKKGEIKIYVRSHYEDVLIQRVHKWVDEKRVDARFDAINAYEKILIEDNNTTILKLFLHISKERQLEKLKERMEEEDKFYKHNPDDWKEREYWDEYRKCYEDCMTRTKVPWYIVPVDQRWYRNYVVASNVLETLENMKLKWPPLKTE